MTRLGKALILCVFMLTSLLGTTAFGETEDVKWIKISSAVDQTGPYALTVAPGAWALLDYFKEVNLTGGFVVDGQRYKVKILTGDTQMKVEKSMSLYRKFVEKGSVFHHIESSGESEAIKELAKRLRVPVFAGGATKKTVNPAGWVFVKGLYPNFNASLMKWYKEEMWPTKKKNRAPRVAFLVWGIPYGKEATVPEFLEYLKKELGYEIVATQEFSPRATTVEPQLRVIKKAKPDIIFLQTLASGSTTAILDAKRLGMTPPAYDWVSNSWCIGQAQFKELGNASEGMYALSHQFFHSVDDTPQLRAMRSAWVRYRMGKNDKLYNSTLLYDHGWAMAVMLEHCLKQAVKKNGFPLTGEMIFDELVNLHNFETGVQSPIDYAYQSRCAWTKIRVYRIHNQDEVIVSDWLSAPPEIFKYCPYIFSQDKWWGTLTNKLPEKLAKEARRR